MDNDLQKKINLHTAGATVTRAPAFDHLETYRNDFELSKEFIDQWVLPLYMNIRNMQDRSWADYLIHYKEDITEDVTLALLGDFNWRTRTVGAYLSALKGYRSQVDLIGTHLLKSEVCYAGDLYAVVLAYYNEPESVAYLNRYLDHYLKKPELYFDQEAVLETIAYLDTVNNTTHLSRHLNQWNAMLESREKISGIRNIQVARIIEEQEGRDHAQKFLNNLNHVIVNTELNTEAVAEQVKFLTELKACFE